MIPTNQQLISSRFNWLQTVWFAIRRRSLIVWIWQCGSWPLSRSVSLCLQCIEHQHYDTHTKPEEDKGRRGGLDSILCRGRFFRSTDQQWHSGFLWPLLLLCCCPAASCWAVRFLVILVIFLFYLFVFVVGMCVCVSVCVCVCVHVCARACACVRIIRPTLSTLLTNETETLNLKQVFLSAKKWRQCGQKVISHWFASPALITMA